MRPGLSTFFAIYLLLLSSTSAPAHGPSAPPGSRPFVYDEADQTVTATMLEEAEFYDADVAVDRAGSWIAWLEFVPGEGDRLWVVYRHFYHPQLGIETPVAHHIEQGWGLFARCLEGRRWSKLYALDVPQRDGLQRLSVAPRDDGLAAVWTTGRTDRRDDPMPRGVAMGVVNHTSGTASEPTLEEAAPAVSVPATSEVPRPLEPAEVGGVTYHLGFIASSDHLSTGASFACVWTPEVGREPIFRSMQARRTFGATDRIRLVFTSGEHWMGERFVAQRVPEFRIEIDGTAPIGQLTVYDNGIATGRLEVPEDRASIRTTYRPDEFFDGEHYLYVHMVQTDGNQAWSSPIWVSYENQP